MGSGVSLSHVSEWDASGTGAILRLMPGDEREINQYVQTRKRIMQIPIFIYVPASSANDTDLPRLHLCKYLISASVFIQHSVCILPCSTFGAVKPRHATLVGFRHILTMQFNLISRNRLSSIPLPSQYSSHCSCQTSSRLLIGEGANDICLLASTCSM